MNTLFLAWRYVTGHMVKSAILIACVAFTAYLPLAVNTLVARGQAQLMARARTTPLVVGARGSRTDLTLHALHFRMKTPGVISVAEVDAVRSMGFGEVIPLYLAFTARDYPVVGTSPAYFKFRHLSVDTGSLPLLLGDSVIGADVAQALGLEPGDALLSDPRNVFDIAGAYPLRMHVAGILARSNSDDDRAVFVDVKTAWVIAGLGHGHQNLAKKTEEDVVLNRTEGAVVANAALPQFNEVTPENIDSFHFHGEPADYPLTAAIVIPGNAKAATLLAGRFQRDGAPGQLARPVDVVEEMMATVFRVKRLFDANVALVTVSTTLLLGLVVLLSLRMRAGEMRTMHRLGCARGTMFWLQCWEWTILLVAGASVAALLAALTGHFARAIIPWLLA